MKVSLKSVLGETPWAFLLNGAISLVCAFGAVWIADQHAESREHRQQVRNDHGAEYAEYVRTTDRFDSAAQTYAGLILSAGKVDERARDDLMANLIDQDRTLDRVGGMLPRSSSATVAQYRVALHSLSGNVAQIKGVGDMQPFWQDLNNLLVLRRGLDDDFREAKKTDG